MDDVPSRAELEAAHCWEAGDRVPRRPQMTAFRRRVRLHQARWREANGHPIGTQPIVPKAAEAVRQVGSRMPLDYARKSGANLVTEAARAATEARTSVAEPHQSFDHQRVWAELLWSPTLAFNLFADLAADTGRADRAVHTWWPDTPGTVREVRFAHSPGRLDPAYLNSLRAFDAAFVLDRGDGTRGIVGLGVRYHEWAKPETPRPSNLQRYLDVAERSGCFRPGVTASLTGKTGLCELWLEHLLVLSMLQHPGGEWTWARYVVVHPAGNVDMVEACAQYRALLADTSTFSAATLEELLDAGVLPEPTAATLRARYVPS